MEVDDVSYSNSNWVGNPDFYFDIGVSFSNNCNNSCSNNNTAFDECENLNKELIKIIDILGRDINEERKTLLFYIYDDGTVEKRIIIE